MDTLFIPMPLQAMADYKNYSWPDSIYYGSSTNYASAKPIIPKFHLGDTTFYTITEGWETYLMLNDYDLLGLQSMNFIKYSSIASMSLRDNTVTDVWIEYKPIAKIDPSTGEVMKDENGNPLYETDEEGNILYEEVESYYEQREADEPITID